MKKFEAKNLKFVSLPEGSNSEVFFTISFDAVDTSDDLGSKISFTTDVIGMSWNSTLTDLVAQAKDAADAIVRDLNKAQHSASLQEALTLVAKELPNIKLSSEEDTTAAE